MGRHADRATLESDLSSCRPPMGNRRAPPTGGPYLFAEMNPTWSAHPSNTAPCSYTIDNGDRCGTIGVWLRIADNQHFCEHHHNHQIQEETRCR